MIQNEFFEKELQKEPYKRTILKSLWEAYEKWKYTENEYLDLCIETMAGCQMQSIALACHHAGLRIVTMSYQGVRAMELIWAMTHIGCEIQEIKLVRSYYSGIEKDWYMIPAVVFKLPEKMEGDYTVDNRLLWWQQENEAMKLTRLKKAERDRRAVKKNAVSLIGVLEDTPFQTVTTNGLKVAKYTVVVSRPKRPGKSQEYDYVECIAFGEAAEEIYPKGAYVEVCGRLKSTIYKNKDGKSSRKIEVQVMNITELEKL